jgi:methylenetetrahydrofolate dehydrogenase (NADP+)/methenyltetrahydrofolate cyclohydrolase
MRVNGKALAEKLYEEFGARRTHLKKSISLGIIVCGADPVIESFVRIKMRAAARLDVQMVRVDIPATALTEDLIAATEELAARTDAVIVQLPLPKHLDTEAVLAAIPKEKDVDAINPDIEEDERLVHAPVALAVVEILKRNHVEIRGKRAVVVGKGRLVGKPSAALLASLGANVSMVTRSIGSIDDLKEADIIVLGAGKPGFVKPEHIKEGVAIIDGGTSESAGKVVGDADPFCEGKAGLFTPVPGGVGPVAVAMIFRNLFDLIESK